MGPKVENDRQLHTFEGGSGPRSCKRPTVTHFWRWIWAQELQMIDSYTLLEVDLGPKAANDRQLHTFGGGSGPGSWK
jgi:hypothetical protein